MSYYIRAPYVVYKRLLDLLKKVFHSYSWYIHHLQSATQNPQFGDENKLNLR